MPIISAIALKGGVGKTSTVHNVSSTLGVAGKRVLVVDADPQASLSSGILGAGAVEGLPAAATIAALYQGQDPLPGQVIVPTGMAGVDILPGSLEAARFNVPEPYLAEPATQWCLQAFLDEVRADYDFILIDCPPNLGLSSWSALLASDYLVVPVIPENYGAMSLSPVFDAISLVQAGPNPRLVMLGMVLTLIQARLGIHAAFESTLRQIHGDAVFAARVATAADIKEAIAVNKSVAQYKPKGASAKMFRALVDEMEARIAASAPAQGREAA